MSERSEFKNCGVITVGHLPDGTTSQMFITSFPSMAEGQIGWYLDTPNNRYLEGDNWIARDWFPQLIVPIQ